MSRWIDIDDDRNCLCGCDGEYEKWNIDHEVLEETITEETAIEFLQSTGWLERHDKALTEFLEYLWNVINPNEMEQYWSMFNAREEKSNE